ncbi:galactose-1-epimerase [Rubrivivax rivuli]|uniref:galactose-1-epimerase n=1 Tax=Rubrivivax rivuli TaxID=1862385 RepID=UPI0013E3CAE6|nr:galactose-1-epimerase [Rubrivivax rivuli]
MSGDLSAGAAAPPGWQVWRLGPADGLHIEVCELGARWMSCRVPLADGTLRETLLGHVDAAAHATEPGYLGAVVGRYANRLAGAAYTLDGQQHRLRPNEGPHQLHGGPEGFDRRRWRPVSSGPLHLRLQLLSPAGDQGHPGALRAEVEYRVDPTAAAVTVHFSAEVDAPCAASLASHAYFNLDGDARSVLGHRLQVAASHLLPVDATLIPTGVLAPVEGTPFDWRTARPIGAGLGQGEQQALAHGYDHCLALDAAAARGEVPAATLLSTDGRLQMQLHTSYPGLQVYSGNFLHASRGRDGLPLARHAGVALEPQFFPNAPNVPAWAGQGCIVRPGAPLSRWMRVAFEAA